MFRVTMEPKTVISQGGLSVVGGLTVNGGGMKVFGGQTVYGQLKVQGAHDDIVTTGAITGGSTLSVAGAATGTTLKMTGAITGGRDSDKLDQDLARDGLVCATCFGSRHIFSRANLLSRTGPASM